MDDMNAVDRLKLDALGEEYYRRHGAAVSLLKSEVGAGATYENQAARAVISENGAWFECIDLPMEFSGASGSPVHHRFVSDKEAVKLLTGLVGLIPDVKPENTREFGMFVLYTRSGISDGRNVYAYQHSARPLGAAETRPTEIGKFQPEVMPLVFRWRIDTEIEDERLPFKRGALFCLAHTGEMNLIVEMPYEGDEVTNLGGQPAAPLKQ